MRALDEPKVARFEEIGAEFCVFKSNAPGLKLKFCEPYVDMPTAPLRRANNEADDAQRILAQYTYTMTSALFWRFVRQF